MARDEYELHGGARLRVVADPAGTTGLLDLWRGSERVETTAGEIRVASVVDLLRIADASTHPSARLEALAFQAVLDVRDAQRRVPPREHGAPSERIDAWLRQQTPVTT